MFGNFLMILQISTHAPLARCDAYEQLCNLGNPISTHAPLARCDVVVLAVQINVQNFNSRTSCEVRQQCWTGLYRPRKFQLTHLLRGATGSRRGGGGAGKFQLTHLLRGATRFHGPSQYRTTDFNSRTSCEVRLPSWCYPAAAKPFQLTHLLRGATAIYCSTFISQTHHLVRGGQVNQIIDLSGVKYCPVLARTGNDFCIIHGSLKHYKIIGPSGS